MKATKKVSTLSAAKRSQIARKAAKAAWRTMNSPAYQRAAKKSKAAIKAYLASRKAA